MTYKTLTFAELQRVIGTTSGKTFRSMIQRMNEMYKLPVNTEPTLDNLPKPNGLIEAASARIKGFLKTLHDEVIEGEEIQAKLVILEYVAENGWHEGVMDTMVTNLSKEWSDDSQLKLRDYASLVANNREEAVKDVLTDIADWTGDIVVYCRSEAMKFGINLEGMLEAIMGSNFTKLPSDGIPKHDENGKFLKDMTNFVPPEAAIKTLMFGIRPDTE